MLGFGGLFFTGFRLTGWGRRLNLIALGGKGDRAEGLGPGASWCVGEGVGDSFRPELRRLSA